MFGEAAPVLQPQYKLVSADASGAASSSDYDLWADGFVGEASLVVEPQEIGRPSGQAGSDEEAAARKRRRDELAQYAECSAVGVQADTQAVQSEVACIRQWRGSSRELYLHRDCLCEMIRRHISCVVLLPEKFTESFPQCLEGETPVALRLPKDDTDVKKEKKDKKENKELAFPKYGHFRALANWRVRHSAVLEVEGVCLGWEMGGNDNMPVGCSRSVDNIGSPEPLDMLSEDDIRTAEAGLSDRPEFLRVTLREEQTASIKLLAFLLRTVFEVVTVHIFMAYLGTQPNNYKTVPYKPWSTEGDGNFHWPGLFIRPDKWRAPGMERIWDLYLETFVVFMALKCCILLLWSVVPVAGCRSKVCRYTMAALYPLCVTVPFKLYLLFFFAAVMNCKACAVWHCGAYSQGQQWKVNATSFKAAGGCSIRAQDELPRFYKHVYAAPENLMENQHCDSMHNAVLFALGIHLETDVRAGSCSAWQDTPEERQDAIIRDMDRICGHKMIVKPSIVTLREEDKMDMPFVMFARDLPIRPAGCAKGDESWTEPYVYFEPDAMHGALPEAGLCVCRSKHGARDCYRETEGSVDRCSQFNGQPTIYGSFLEYDISYWGSSTVSVSLFLFITIPIYGLFSVLAWAELPLGGQDKMDLRLSSRMKLDILDFFLFFQVLVDTANKHDRKLSLVKYLLTDMAWHDFEMYVWFIAWVSAYVWMSMVVFLHIFDDDPDKTPKTWKSVNQILSTADASAQSLMQEPQVKDPYGTALRKQGVLYEKEVQKYIKKRTVVDIFGSGLESGEDGASSSSGEDSDSDVESLSPKSSRKRSRARRATNQATRHLTTARKALSWKRCLIVFSDPKIKDMGAADFRPDTKVFTLYVIGAMPWSRPPKYDDVWSAETWQEYIANREGGPDVTPHDVGLEVIKLTYDELLTRVRPTTGYLWFDVRFLGWCNCCHRQPKFEYKKLKEDDSRITERERRKGFSETYWNKYQFDWWERNVELVSSFRSLVVDSLFFAARMTTGLWNGGFDNWLSVLLTLKNFMFVVLGLMYICACGNPKHNCGLLDCSPFELIAKCIERTKIGNAIKLGMLMPLRIAIECASCGFRILAEERQDYCSRRMHMLLLQRSRSVSGADELDHEIRLLASKVQGYADVVETLNIRHIVNMKAKVKAKDVIG